MHFTFKKPTKAKSKLCPGCNKPMFHQSTGRTRFITRDHILLKSLGGTETNELCNFCNSTRANIFAEQAEFLQWVKDKRPELPYKKNFCYLSEKPELIKAKKDAAKARAKLQRMHRIMTGTNNKSTSQSTLIDSYVQGDKLIKVYKHPLFGISNVVEDLVLETN